jgi:hypothetical protein
LRPLLDVSRCFIRLECLGATGAHALLSAPTILVGGARKMAICIGVGRCPHIGANLRVGSKPFAVAGDSHGLMGTIHTWRMERLEGAKIKPWPRNYI